MAMLSIVDSSIVSRASLSSARSSSSSSSSSEDDEEEEEDDDKLSDEEEMLSSSLSALRASSGMIKHFTVFIHKNPKKSYFL